MHPLTVAGALVLLAGLLAGSIDPVPVDAQAPSESPEQRLVDTYAPIVMIEEQQRECSSDGEQFRPVVVDIIFGTDDVRLMQRGEGGQPDREVKRNIQASDLYGLDDRHYIDLPFDPRNPGCHYERWGKQRMAELGLTPSLYAFVLERPEEHRIVVQYWYYWIYNLFNDVHESDWEGIQVAFDAGSVQEILDRQLMPSSIAFAQHGGGELGYIGQDKVEMRGTHVVSHPSSGSHADYYENAIWLGWGEDGSGFGCDHAEEPDIEIPVHIVLLPNQVDDPNSPFAWLTFQGNWGEIEKPSLFSGPKGPMQHWRWHHPVTWTEEIRTSSLPVPTHPSIGPGIAQVFCGAAVLGSRIVRVVPVNALAVSGFILGLGIALLLFTLVVWRYTWHALRLYVRHGYFFITVGLLSLPIAVLGQRLEDVVQDLAEANLVQRLPGASAWWTIYEFVVHAIAGTIQELMISAIVGPVVIIATHLILSAEGSTNRPATRSDFRLYPRIAASRILSSTLVSLMFVSIVLSPLGVYKGVQWFFAPQAVGIDDASVRASLPLSADRMRGDWIRAAAMVVAFAAMVGLPGPLIGMALVTTNLARLDVARWISGVLFCALYPIGTIAATIYYLRRANRLASVETYEPAHGRTAAALAPA